MILMSPLGDVARGILKYINQESELRNEGQSWRSEKKESGSQKGQRRDFDHDEKSVFFIKSSILVYFSGEKSKP